MLSVLPDLLTFENGEPVTAGTWERRRRELHAAIIPHEYGGLPPAPAGVTVIRKSDSMVPPQRKIRFITYEIRSQFDIGEHSMNLNLWVPEGEGPFPVVLDGDGCWRYFDDAIIKRVVERGYIAASFNRTDTAADNWEQYRETGLYRLFPDGEFGAVAAWAWGYHRCVDALFTFDFADGQRIAVTGHSRGGKTVLLAGAADSRIAVTNPNCSGAGGSGLNHLKAEGAERIADFFRSKMIFWFGHGFAACKDRDGELPYDQHFLHALTAPRGLLITEAYGDKWANPPGSYLACLEADNVYTLLGARDNLGWLFREGGHSHSPYEFETLLDFLDFRFFDRAPERCYRRNLFPDLEAIISPA